MKDMLEKLRYWLKKKKDCRSCCLWCDYWDTYCKDYRKREENDHGLGK